MKFKLSSKKIKSFLGKIRFPQFKKKKKSGEEKNNSESAEEEVKRNKENILQENTLEKLEQEIKNNTASLDKELKDKKKKDEKTSEENDAELALKAKRAFAKKAKKPKRRIQQIFTEYLLKGGYDTNGEDFNKKLKRISVGTAILSSLILSIVLAGETHLSVFLIFLILSFGASMAAIYILLLVGSFMFLDYKIYSRTKEIEEVLPEFLQLTSANISAGMPIDRALWFAVRPKFGVLAKEIEEVAKATMAGEDLEQALENFTNKYDSRTLRESINLLVEGMRAGGEIGFLLNQIASNMQDIKIMRKEIAASVMSYVIFISIAAIVGAPFLLALSSQLLFIMKGISSSVQVEDNPGSSSSSFNIDMSSDSISMGDFKIFAIVVLLFTSVFSAMIISVIRKGNTNESFKIIPGYLAVSIIIYIAASALFGSMLGGFF